MDLEINQDAKADVEPKPVEQKPKPKSKKKQRKVPSDPTKRRAFLYDSRHDNLGHYGVIVEWDEKNLTHNQIHSKFERVLSALRTPPDTTKEVKRSKQSIKRKSMPYFRRTGRTKGIVTFNSGSNANAFSAEIHPDFRTFIPMSFVVTIGVVHFNAPKVNIKEAFASCADNNLEIMQWRIKRLESNKLRVTFAVCGTELPGSLLFHDKSHPVERYARQPVRCNRCQRYGHRTGSCFRQARCGTCAQERPAVSSAWHTEKACRIVRADRGKVRCTYCNERHATGSADCGEENYQRTYKGQLAKHNMDFVKTLEREIIPMVRSTSINSNRIWCD
ncbi:uncharacterized protein LOC120414110 [Culex pipiens pallens]|uniref:uncharacterized protein LOC120414110 n=1 Tax=Culex pipiens pallens TaxID=42434 RepID=UPI001954C85D|nr:uncharacterized protein LOC120414110 [Culex pipiens pallens]